ncbi:enoyl-CoA hydratase-related protein [Geofilum rubicundum]|nr:enoyl-CoA hydratase-related protein [Geofilum rubicundum]
MALIKKFGEGVCYLELNRPEKRNALSKGLVVELTRFFEETAQTSQFKVLVISGKGGFFCAGADLEWMKAGAGQTMEENLADARLFNRLFEKMDSYPKPIILRVDKGAYGGALGLVACADMVTTTPTAQFLFSEVRLGLIPATIAPYIVKRIGLPLSKQLMLTASEFSGTEAHQIQLVNFLFPEENLSVKTRELATKMAKNSPSALRQTKELVNRLGNSLVPINEEVQEHCARLIAEARMSDDGQEGVSAFFEKRKANWNDKQ